MPATVRLVLSSRFDPPLSLPRLRLGGRLSELRAAQLSFTPHQAAALLAKLGLRVSQAEAEVLCARTGGWAAGLRLAAYGMAESSDREAFLAQFSGDDRSVADYLSHSHSTWSGTCSVSLLAPSSISIRPPLASAAASAESLRAAS